MVDLEWLQVAFVVVWIMFLNGAWRTFSYFRRLEATEGGAERSVIG